MACEEFEVVKRLIQQCRRVSYPEREIPQPGRRKRLPVVGLREIDAGRRMHNTGGRG